MRASMSPRDGEWFQAIDGRTLLAVVDARDLSSIFRSRVVEHRRHGEPVLLSVDQEPRAGRRPRVSRVGPRSRGDFCALFYGIPISLVLWLLETGAPRRENESLSSAKDKPRWSRSSDWSRWSLAGASRLPRARPGSHPPIVARALPGSGGISRSARRAGSRWSRHRGLWRGSVCRVRCFAFPGRGWGMGRRQGR